MQEPYQINSKHWFLALLIALFLHGAIFLSYKLNHTFDDGDDVHKNIVIRLKSIATVPEPENLPIEERIIEPVTTPHEIAKPRKKHPVEVKKKTEKPQLVKPVKKTKPQIEPLPFTRDKFEKTPEVLTRLVNNKEVTNTVRKNYESVLISWLNKHKKYPNIARRRGYEGSVILTFEMDANGNLLSYQIKKVSEHDSLNSAVINMIKKASPMPPVPNKLRSNRSKFSYTVPIHFVLNK